MHSGVQTHRTHERMVIPAYAGIQEMPLGWIPAPVSSGAGMTCKLAFPRCIPIRRTMVKMHNML